jgi:hypothetical protein
MTPSDDALLSELEGILKEAEARVNSERAEGINKEFMELESSMWQELGAVNEAHQVFSVSVVPKEQHDKAMSDIDSGAATVVNGDGSIEGHDADTLVRLNLIAETSDIYEALENKLLALHVGRDTNAIGVLLRMSAKATLVNGEPANDHDPKEPQEVVVTTMLMSDHVYVATRFLSKPDEVNYQTIHADDYKGEHQLVNALVAFFMGAKEIYEANPEVADALYQDLSRQREKETSNNKQQSKEDNAQ